MLIEPRVVEQKIRCHHVPRPFLSTWAALVMLMIATVIAYFNSYDLLSSPTASVYSTNCKEELREPIDCDLADDDAPTPLAVNPLVIFATGAAGVVTTKQLLSLSLKPILIEVGAVIVLQAVGLPLLGTAGNLLRRIRIVQLGRTLHIPSPILRQIAKQGRLLSRTGTQVWKAAGTVYSKTSLSKIVQRTKKLVKVFSSSHDDEQEQRN